MGDLIQEILTQIGLITEFKFSSVWNNQFQYMEEGNTYVFPMPCAFVEIISDNNQDVAGKYQGSDIQINIHIGHEFYNGTQMEQNLSIFDFRDLIVKSFCNFKAGKTGVFIKTSEQQDFEHTNVYHYIVSFKTHFMDDTAAPEYIYTTPPTGLTIDRNG